MTGAEEPSGPPRIAMWHGGRHAPWNAATVLMAVIGCGFLAAGVWDAWQTTHFLSAASRAAGSIVEPEGHPLIRFALPDGRAVEFRQNGFVSRPLGAAVPVAYRPEDPAGTAQADTFWADWGTVLGSFWIGLGFTVLPLFGLRAEFRAGRW